MARRDDLSIAEDLERKAAQARSRHAAKRAVEAGGITRDIEKARRLLVRVNRARPDDVIQSAMDRLELIRSELLKERAAALDAKE